MTDSRDPRDPRDRSDDGRSAPLGVAAYVEARTRAEEALVRGAFDDLRSCVRADVKPPPARSLLDGSRRRRVRATQRRLAFASAAAVLVAGGAALVVRNAPDGDRRGSFAATAAPRTSTTPALPPEVTPAPASSSASPPAPAGATGETGTPTRTVVVTVRPPSSPSRTRRPSATRTSTPAASPSTSAGPRTEVTVYLWQGTQYPTCLNQYAVKRTVDGTGGWAAAVRATLAGATSAERAAGYVSPFGSGVRASVDEGSHRVDFGSTSAFDGVAPLCRGSLESLVTRTATDAGYPATVTLHGSMLLWTNWRIGLM